jgi:hypothetical protein
MALFQERIKRYCLIPNVSHKEDVKITAPNSVIRTSPNSLSISRIAKSEDAVTRIYKVLSNGCYDHSGNRDAT